jgi:hypothetical protein
MSLNWNLKKIANSNDLYIPGKADPMGGNFIPVKPGTQEKGKEFLNPITDALIWSCMAVEIGEIKESNVDEFWLRLSIWQRVSGSMCQFAWGGGKQGLTRNDVKRHVGLSCNVITKSRAVFMKKIAEILVRDAYSGKPDPDEKSLLDQYKEKLESKFAEAKGK